MAPDEKVVRWTRRLVQQVFTLVKAIHTGPRYGARPGASAPRSDPERLTEIESRIQALKAERQREQR